MAAAISPNERGPAAHHTWEVEVPPCCLWPQRLSLSAQFGTPLWGCTLCGVQNSVGALWDAVWWWDLVGQADG